MHVFIMSNQLPDMSRIRFSFVPVFGSGCGSLLPFQFGTVLQLGLSLC